MRVVLVALLIAVTMEGAALAWKHHREHARVPIGEVTRDGPGIACREGQTIVTVGCRP